MSNYVKMATGDVTNVNTIEVNITSPSAEPPRHVVIAQASLAACPHCYERRDVRRDCPLCGGQRMALS